MKKMMTKLIWQICFFLVDINNIVLEMNILLNIIFCDEMCIWN